MDVLVCMAGVIIGYGVAYLFTRITKWLRNN